MKNEENEVFKEEIKSEINEHLKLALNESPISVNLDEELKDIYKPFELAETPPNKETSELRFIDAISDGLRQAMKKHDGRVWRSI